MGEIEKIRAALEPFALSIRDHVPDSRLITTVAWTAGQHRAVCEALGLLEAMAKRIAELEAEAGEGVPGREEIARKAEVYIAWLDEAARYFGGRPTDGEDSAHWSNVFNAQNCREIAAIRALAEPVNKTP